MKGDKSFRACDRHRNETVTLMKIFVACDHMRKWMSEFLKKFEDRGIKIVGVN